MFLLWYLLGYSKNQVKVFCCCISVLNFFFKTCFNVKCFTWMERFLPLLSCSSLLLDDEIRKHFYWEGENPRNRWSGTPSLQRRQTALGSDQPSALSVGETQNNRKFFSTKKRSLNCQNVSNTNGEKNKTRLFLSWVLFPVWNKLDLLLSCLLLQLLSATSATQASTWPARSGRHKHNFCYF